MAQRFIAATSFIPLTKIGEEQRRLRGWVCVQKIADFWPCLDGGTLLTLGSGDQKIVTETVDEIVALLKEAIKGKSK